MRLFEKAFSLPFKADRFGEYLFDANNNMIAMSQTEDIMSLNLIDSIINKKSVVRLKVKYDSDSGLITMNDDPLMLIRGWGYLTGIGSLNLPEEEAVAIQDDLANYIVEKLTTK